MQQTQPATSIRELRDRVIEDGIAEIKTVGYPPHKERGAIAGMEYCRLLLTPAQFRMGLDEERKKQEALRRSRPEPHGVDDREHLERYWEQAMLVLQIEFVYEVMRIAWGEGPAWSGRAMRVYAKHVAPEQYGAFFDPV